jgi:hypothetical protein
MFPDFHSSWLTDLKRALNHGRLPSGYYAMAEQRAELYGPDVLTLTELPRPAPANPGGGVAVAVRHASGERVVAVIELVSPRNKDRALSVGDFAGKVAGLVRRGVHAVVIDILPPGRFDPGGMHAAIWPGLDTEPDPVAPPADQPLTFAGYRADERPVAYLSYAGVGQPLPDVPLFLDDGVFVEVPLEQTYMTNYAELPAELKAALN